MRVVLHVAKITVEITLRSELRLRESWLFAASINGEVQGRSFERERDLIVTESRGK